MDYPITCFSMEKGTIRLVQVGLNSFTTTYGMQVIADLSYAQAASNLGSIIMHHAACEGRLDNRDYDEVEDTVEID